MSKENARARLLENYSPDEHGTWKIFGEDQNAELTGPHHEPKLQTVTGTYGNVVEYALTLDGFFSWGRGGRIEKKACQTKLLNVDALSNPRVIILEAERKKLQARIWEIENEISNLTKE
jgi:hypothetical protein